MGTVLMWVGGLWALVGGANVVSMFATAGHSTNLLMFGLIFNFVLFILPGLAVYGIGARMAAHGSRAPCPYCAERIKEAASVCPHCQRDLQAGWSINRRKIFDAEVS